MAENFPKYGGDMSPLHCADGFATHVNTRESYMKFYSIFAILADLVLYYYMPFPRVFIPSCCPFCYSGRMSV